MNRVETISRMEIVRLTGKSPEAISRRVERECKRKGIVLPENPEDGRGNLVPASLFSALYPKEHQAWLREQTCAALRNVNGQAREAFSQGETSKQPPLPFAALSQNFGAFQE